MFNQGIAVYTSINEYFNSRKVHKDYKARRMIKLQYRVEKLTGIKPYVPLSTGGNYFFVKFTI